MGLPLNVLPALTLLSQSITCYDRGDTTPGEYVDGRWVPGAVKPDYTISGSIQPASEKDLKFLPEGAASEGVVSIHTTAQLYIEDVSNETGISGRQTFVRFSGEVWRVTKKADWVGPGGFSKWLAVKYLDQS